MGDKDKELLEGSNPLYAKKKSEKVELNTKFEFILLDCLSLSIGANGLEILVIWEFADQNELDRLWLLKWLKVSYGNYMEMEMRERG